MKNAILPVFKELETETQKIALTDLENNIHKTFNYYILLEIYGQQGADKWLSLCKRDDSDGMISYQPTKESIAYNAALRN